MKINNDLHFHVQMSYLKMEKITKVMNKQIIEKLHPILLTVSRTICDFS